MPKSLASIKSQIEKLQKQAESIQTTVISRIKKEIAQHGLSVDDLFGTGIRSVGNGKAVQPKAGANGSRPSAAKPAKYADDKGNSWHGVGKRPQWIHQALAAGRALEEFLLGKAAKPAAAPSAAPKKKPAAKKAASRRSVKPPAAKQAKAATGSPAKKAAKATSTAKPARKVAAKKAPTNKRAKSSATATVEAPAAQG